MVGQRDRDGRAVPLEGDRRRRPGGRPGRGRRRCRPGCRCRRCGHGVGRARVVRDERRVAGRGDVDAERRRRARDQVGRRRAVDRDGGRARVVRRAAASRGRPRRRRAPRWRSRARSPGGRRRAARVPLSVVSGVFGRSCPATYQYLGHVLGVRAVVVGADGLVDDRRGVAERVLVVLVVDEQRGDLQATGRLQRLRGVATRVVPVRARARLAGGRVLGDRVGQVRVDQVAVEVARRERLAVGDQRACRSCGCGRTWCRRCSTEKSEKSRL